MRPAWLLALVAAGVLAGCAADEAATPPAMGAPRDAAGRAPSMAAARPAAPMAVADAGDIRGPFEEAWEVGVPQVGASGLHVAFNLTGTQPGAPPTARVRLVMLAPDGAELASALVGLGAGTDRIQWSFGPAEVAQPGAYLLKAAVVEEAVGLPSGGLARYAIYAYAEY